MATDGGGINVGEGVFVGVVDGVGVARIGVKVGRLVVTDGTDGAPQAVSVAIKMIAKY